MSIKVINNYFLPSIATAIVLVPSRRKHFLIELLMSGFSQIALHKASTRKFTIFLSALTSIHYGMYFAKSLQFMPVLQRRGRLDFLSCIEIMANLYLCLSWLVEMGYKTKSYKTGKTLATLIWAISATVLYNNSGKRKPAVLFVD